MNRSGLLVIMDSRPAFLSLLQLCDSFFPSGSFAYSWGLETYTGEGLIKDRAGLVCFIKAHIGGLMKQCDCRVVKLSCDAAQKKDIQILKNLDARIHSLKLVKETRMGSIQTGRQVLQVIRSLEDSAFLGNLSEHIQTGAIFGHHPVIFGAACGVMGIGVENAVPAYLYATASSIVSAGLRLIPLGHTDGQKAIHELKPFILETCKEVMATGKESDEFSSFAPALEIRAMRHEILYSRLFKS